jgi:hypothetical protein
MEEALGIESFGFENIFQHFSFIKARLREKNLDVWQFHSLGQILAKDQNF